MISFLDAKQNRFLHDLNKIQARADRAQSQITSGLRIQNASDAPDEIGELLQARSELAAAIQTKTNLGRIKAEIDAGESALSNSIQLLERVRVLGAQGLNGTQTPETRRSVASEVESILRQLVGLANTASDGRYLFAGSLDQAPPYNIDLNAVSGVTTYAGSAATRQVRDSSGVLFNVSRSGQEIFESTDPTRNVFQAVNALRVALLANDTPAMESAMSNVGTSLTHLNEQLAYYGTVQNTVVSSQSAVEGKILHLRTRIEQAEGTDLAEAILELQQATIARQAALEAKGREDRRTVFDFLL
jgi:flagellar hook-associated protein 3 FlgL